MNSITQDMKSRQSLLTYAQKYGVSPVSYTHLDVYKRQSWT